ncbi:MAG: phosphomannomutase/phosphoglucomutase [bacterium]|nr:phosphomannomutase/phosphoglucomutase [bacterium]
MDWMKLKSGSDIRGKAVGEGAVITPAVCMAMGMAFARFVAERKHKPVSQVTIALGRDSRISGPELLRAAAEGVSRAGASVLDFGLCTTPAMYMSIITPGFQPDASVMITASHHPYDRNGMKFFLEDGGIESSVVVRLLEMASEMNPMDFAISGAIVEKPFLPTYKEQLAQRIRRGLNTDVAKPLLGLHVVVDAGNGAGGFYAELMEELGAWIEGSQFLNPDGMFPNHIPNPENEEAMASICAAVKKSGADIGVIFDTDCDRAAVVDADGREINRNRLIALISAILLDEKPGQTIVTDSVTSSGLKKFINAWGGEHYRFKRGYRNVIDEAIRLESTGISCPLAIETSGHAAMKENHYLDDGMYLVTVLIVRAMKLKQEGKTLGSLIADLQEPVESSEIRLSITAEDFREAGKQAIALVMDYANAAETWHIAPDNREGVRISFDLDGGMDNGWFLLRLSVHDPVLPLNVESDVPGGVKQMLRSLYAVLKGCEGIDLSPLEKAIAE